MTLTELFERALQICGYITTIYAAAVLLIRPLRKRVLGTKQIEDGQKCLLRSDMLRTYYHHREEHSIRQYEYENFEFEYRAYKALGGNSFIDKIYSEVKGWEVLT